MIFKMQVMKSSLAPELYSRKIRWSVDYKFICVYIKSTLLTFGYIVINTLQGAKPHGFVYALIHGSQYFSCLVQRRRLFALQ
jgi:hypothetical protein